MVTIRPEAMSDVAARDKLLDRAFGKSRRRKTAERLRAGRLPAEGLAFVAADEGGRLIATIRLWNVMAGAAGPALMLGPLAVDAGHQRQGIGRAMMAHALEEAKKRGHRAVILVGEEPYYRRFGFAAAPVANLQLPGPVERQRFLGLELAEGGLAGASGLVSASGRPAGAVKRAA